MTFYIVLNTENPGFDEMVDGRILSHHSDFLDRLAASAGVKPLIDFFSTTLADYAELSGVSVEEVQEWAEKAIASGGNPPSLEAEWYSPAEGLTTVRALQEQITSNPDAVSSKEAILIDLGEFERVLAEAAIRGLRWHLAIDY